MVALSPYCRGPTWALYHADALRVMSGLHAGTVDLILADPPYHLSNGGTTCSSGKRVSVDKGQWDRSAGPADDLRWNIAWLEAARRLLAPDGTIFISGTRHNIYIVGAALQQLGFKLLNDIIWEKPAPPPNLSCRYFTHDHETIIWAARSARSRYTFNYPEMKQDNDGKQMKSIWRISPPRPAEKTHGKHPCQKPVDLLSRLIRAATNPGDLVFDPFAGSCSTGVSALQQGRLFVGVDNDSKWLDVGARRMGFDMALDAVPTRCDDASTTMVKETP